MPKFLIAVFACLLVIASPVLAEVPVIKAGETFLCTPTHVYDGDGPIWCEEGPRIRLSGIAAREINGSCKVGHPCPDASAETARDTLVQLIGTPTGGTSQHGHILIIGPTMTCISTGHARGSRTGAWCVSPKSGDVNCAMLAADVVAKWEDYWKNHVCR